MTKKKFDSGPGFARKLDEKDELADIRNEFLIADSNLIYLDGNSLGRLPRQTIHRLQKAIEVEWGEKLIGGWNFDWYQAPIRVGEKIAKILGASPGQVVVSDSTSVNFFKLVSGALSVWPDRNIIISDVLNFPSDLYVLQGIVRWLGNRHNLLLCPSVDGISADEKAIIDSIDERVALVTLSHVAFKSGFLYNVPLITEAAHKAGALVLWDLSHSVGAVPIKLDQWEVDLAVGCTYKYLNGGPGSPAFLYVRKGLRQNILSPIQGWFGQSSPFGFDLSYHPPKGMRRFLVGTPPVLSLAAIEPALDLLLDIGIDKIRKKSIRLTSYLIELIDARLTPLGFCLGTPREIEKRGSHISIRHPEGYQINRALIEDMGVLPDFREPDNIRFGLAPLYTSFRELWEAVDRICRVMEERRYLHFSRERLPVT